MIHPRRLKGTAANIARYYTVGDYYTKGAEEQSLWGGAIAPELGLAGPVDPAVFKELLAGRVAGQQLGRHRADGELEHHPGWDFAINAPKSVSIMALVTGDERIIAVHERAVTEAISYLEDHASLRRREKGEIVHETTGRLLFARFTEHASRELDPHLHTHIVVLNLTNREADAAMASLETRAMFSEQMTGGQVYRNALAFGLRELGYGIDTNPRTGLFEIKGVPQELMRHFSQRAEQIEAHAQEHGLAGQAARREAFYATRGAKQKAGHEELRSRWDARSEPHREALGKLREAAGQAEERELMADKSVSARAALFGLRQAETREAVNNRGNIIRLGLASHVGEVRLSDLTPVLNEHEARAKLLATPQQTGDRVLTRGRTSRATARRERAFTGHLALALGDATPIASSDALLRVLETAGLKSAQERALVETATARDRVTAIHGVAGAGKSTLVKVLRQAAEPGKTLIALAPTSSAAAELGQKAGIESRTVASFLASRGAGLTPDHVLVLDEAGQLGNRHALRVLEISRDTGARLLLLGDNKQTGAIEQGKAFWLLQRLGMPTAELTESVRQETRSMKAAVTEARAGNFAGSLGHLDKITSGTDAVRLAEGLVAEWTRLKPETRTGTNILVLDNATRLVVNRQVRETLKREGVVAAEDMHLQILGPAGMSSEEKRFARFYSGGQVVTFGRDDTKAGLAQGTEYRVVGTSREASGRQIVRLVDENGRVVRWDPRTARASQVNVFVGEERHLSEGDRIQWRLVTKALDLKNAERGTVEKLDGSIASIRWDRGGRIQEIDLTRYKTWDHGYAETVYSAQSKTYARAYVLAPVNSSLVNGQNYYTAITRARLGVKLWTEDPERLTQKLADRSGEKTSSLEGLGLLDRIAMPSQAAATERMKSVRSDLEHRRQIARDQRLIRIMHRSKKAASPADRLAVRAREVAETIDGFLRSLIDRGQRASSQEKMQERASPAQQDRAERPDRGPER